MKTVIFFSNGNSVMFINNEQQPLTGWLPLFLEQLKAEGHNPEEFEYMLPNGKNAEVFELEDGSYNWKIK